MQLCSNNVAEYQALILGLEIVVEMNRLQLQVFGDSQLVINQLLVPPPNEVEGEENELKHLVVVSETEKEEWRQPIINYLIYGILPESLRRRTEIRRRAPRFLYYKDTLYRRSLERVLLRCLGEEEALQALQESHSGMGYYWPTMVKDCLDYARRCKACQLHANFIHQPPEVLHPTVASLPFDAWGLDIVGPLPNPLVGIYTSWLQLTTSQNGLKLLLLRRLMNKICDFFVFKQRKSSMYNAAANGLAEGSSLQNGMGHMAYKKLTQVGLTSWLMQIT
ncbi:uncharacterized protein [Nicotiana tomentosiformis]|uniref:uncharacterized protein n=1 Tax=Nicotiana tomentosiformis TaxID=4098 RepID=UPI00388C64AF